MTRVLVVALVALLVVPVARASEQHPTLAELEGEVMCPVCGTTLDQSDSPAAQQIKRVIANGIAAGQTKGEIKQKPSASSFRSTASRTYWLGRLYWRLAAVLIRSFAPAGSKVTWRSLKLVVSFMFRSPRLR